MAGAVSLCVCVCVCEGRSGARAGEARRAVAWKGRHDRPWKRRGGARGRRDLRVLNSSGKGGQGKL